VWQLGFMEAIAGKFISVLDPFLRSAAPLLESVAEHRITAWGSIYFNLGFAILFFLAGLYFTLRNPTNRNIFLLLFAATSLYFASSMVRLLVIFAPAYSLLVGMGIMGVMKPFYTLLREAPQIALKSKRRVARVSKEYSGIAIFLVFILLVTNLALSPQNGGMPRVYSQAYSPLTVSAASLPLSGNSLSEPANEWLDMLSWTSENLQSTDVVCAWWDYGYWLSILGNVTTLADNATVNATQIENIGFIFMAPENQSLKMLAQYNAKYILVFTTLGIRQSSDQQSYVVTFSRFGDEVKWSWMARISGQARERLIQEGYMTEQTAWSDETSFGNYTLGTDWIDLNQNGTPDQGETITNTQGQSSTIYKLMSWAKQRWADVGGASAGVQPDMPGVQPEYFTEIYFSGENLSLIDISSKYSGLIPIVALYEIDWQAYYSATGQP
jgi:dolichyl-diphosphooligosaccharide--protein glycosyltransferase